MRYLHASVIFAARAHLSISHIDKAVRKIDIAYTSASTAEYHVESHHPKARPPIAAAPPA